MAEIAFSCPACGHSYQVNAQLAGKQARCKVCKAVSRIPVPDPGVTSRSLGEAPGLSFPCPRCGYSFSLDACLAGKRALCKHCGEVFRVPDRASGQPAQHVGDEPSPDPAGGEYSLVKFVGLAVGLLLLVWACSSLFPRAWNAGQALLGVADKTNDPVKSPNGDPGLDTPDISPSRVELVHQHEQALEEMAQAFFQMARGYAIMQKPASFAAGQKEVGQATEKLDQAAHKGASLAKLEPAEKMALGYSVNTQLKKNAGFAAQELNKLMRTPGIHGDFDKLFAAINQSRQQFDREFGDDPVRPGVLLIMSKIQDPAQQQIISQKATAKVDRSSFTSAGWSIEGETSQLKIAPVYSAQAYAERIDFGKVRRVKGRRIEIDVNLPSAQ